ncbi:MAG: secretin N-terminal domain-containing protein [Myxococcota bacterium]
MPTRRFRSIRLRWSGLLVALACALGPPAALELHAQAPVPPAVGGRPPGPGDARILLNQKRMDIDQLIELVSKETRRTILFDEQVGGMVSLVSKRPVTEEEAWALLDSALHLLGFALVPSTVNQWRIARIAEAVGESPFTERARSGSDRYVTALIPLEAAGLQSVLNVLQPMAGSTVTLVPLEATHSLIASGPESSIARLTEIADELDRVEERGLRQRVLRYRDVADVDAMIQAQFESGRFADRELEVWSDERTNSLIFRGAPDAVDRLIGFLEQIDVPIEGEGEIRILRVLNREAGEIAQILGGQASGSSRSKKKKQEDGAAGQGGDTKKPTDPTTSKDATQDSSRTTGTNANAANLNAANVSAADMSAADAVAADLNAAPEDGLTPQAPQTPPTPGFASAVSSLDLKSLLGGEDYSIVVDEPTRSLVVRASERGHRVIRELVEKLDARPQLIAVDITISEVRTPSSLALSLSYHVPLLPGDSLNEYVGRLISVPTGGGFRTTPIADSALFGRVSRDAGINFDIPGAGGVLIPIEDTGEIDASSIKARVEILNQPSLVIVAGEEHELFVGSNIPIPVSQGTPSQTGGTTSGSTNLLGVSVTFNRQDVGVRIRLEAQAGEVGPIDLRLDTELSSLGPSVAGDPTKVGPTLIKEALTAKARLEDGETAIIGVDRERTETTAVGGTPWLTDIPFLGWFFKARGKVIQDNRLVIAARARRVSTPAELVADTIRRRIAFDRQRAREQNLPDSGGAPYGVRVTTRSLESDAVAIARDLERKGHRTRVQRWQGIDRRELFDVYVMGFDSLSEAGDLALSLADDGWDADLVVFSTRRS